MFVLDSHCDTPSQVLRLRDLSIDNRRGHVDFPKLKRGGVDASFFALYIPAELDSPSAFVYARKLLGCTLRHIEDKGKGMAVLTREADEALSNKKKGLVSIFLGLENASPIGEDIDRFHWFRQQGVRYITLCHNSDNLVCDSAVGSSHTHSGLSGFGRELVRQMNESGVLVDCAHISDESFYDVARLSTKPFVSTHSCCRALSNHPRNMTDDMIRVLADCGGVIQINFYPVFLDVAFAEIIRNDPAGSMDYVEEEFIKDPSNPLKRAAWEEVLDRLQALKRPPVSRIVDHIEHVASLVGIEHVGIGTDFDGISVTPAGMEDISCMPVLFDEMRRRGFSESDIAKVAGENFLRVLH